MSLATLSGWTSRGRETGSAITMPGGQLTDSVDTCLDSIVSLVVTDIVFKLLSKTNPHYVVVGMCAGLLGTGVGSEYS